MAIEKRERLLRAAKAAVARAGVAGATVASIAREAGITPGLVHYYFPSKQALVHALFDRLVVDFGARLEPSPSEPAEVVRGFVRAALSLGDDADPEAVRVWGWLAAEALRDEGLRARLHEVANGWVSRVAAALQELGAFDARELAGAFVSAVVGAWQLGAVAPGVVTPGSADRAQRRILEALLTQLEEDRARS